MPNSRFQRWNVTSEMFRSLQWDAAENICVNNAHLEFDVTIFICQIRAMSETARDKVVAEMETWLIERKQAIELLKCLDQVVLEAAVDCLESPLGAGNFLTTPARSLGNKIPADVASTPEGKEQVLNLIRAIEHGVYL